jgi:predicted transcriptional regulator
MEKTHELLANGKVFRANFELIASMNEEEPDKTTIKPANRNRNKGNRRQIIDFIADNGISDAKTVSKAIGLKSSRTRDYLKQLVDEGILEVEGEYKNRKYRIKK